MESEILKGKLNINIEKIVYNSSEAEPNSMFVAISGFDTDGHQYIEDAINRGAQAIIVEKNLEIEADVTVIKVSDSRKALALAAANFYDHPTKDLDLIGITGTNGKTSTTFFLKSILEQAEKSIGIIGTIGTFIDDFYIKNKNTTPESLNLQQIFSHMKEVGVDTSVIEVSSHSLSLNRVAYSDFNTAIFTNLTPDHLELHKSMEDYFLAKAKLFDMASGHLIINADDPYGQRLIDMHRSKSVKIVSYGVQEKSDIFATNITYSADSTKYILHTPAGKIDILVNVPGDVNVYNSLAAAACAYAQGFSLEQISKGISALTHIKGRFEEIYNNQDIRVVVDFAHTEDGLQKALSTLRPFTKGRLIVVFGVYAPPGEEGREKRLAMGNVAAEYADFAIVTSDNPKNQDPNEIIKEVVEAMESSGGNYRTIVDREKAIQYALEMSQSGDVILLAGKGHETSQIIGDVEIPFNESEIVNEYMKNRKLSV